MARNSEIKPPTPKEVKALYSYGREYPMKPARDESRQQFIENEHGPGYDNDVPLTGKRGWLRGGGPRHAEGRPSFDHVGNPGPAKGGWRNEASGQDMTKSPFSAASKTWKD